MSLEDRVLALIVSGNSPGEIVSALSIRRDQYYTAVRALEAKGTISKAGELPDGAVTEVCPPPEVMSLFADVFDVSGWPDRILATVHSFCSRYGWIEPAPPDRRYTRVKWTGQAVRRVDFEHLGTKFMVCGFLVPRADKKAWDRATPRHRIIYIETSAADRPVSWRLERGRPVSADTIDALMSVSERNPAKTPPELYTALAIAVAWVNESRAVFARTIRTVKGGPANG